MSWHRREQDNARNPRAGTHHTSREGRNDAIDRIRKDNERRQANARKGKK